MDMLNTLRVTGVHALPSAAIEVEIDEYVPLRFRTSREPLGVAYVRLGNYSDTLLELGVDPRTQCVRGVTVTSISNVSAWIDFEVSETIAGLPVLATSLEGSDVLDLPNDFMTATRPGQILVYWKHLTRCTAYAMGTARFLVADTTLVGVLFTNLTEKDITLYESQAGS